MSIRVTQSLLAIGLLLGVAIDRAPAQHRRPPEPPTTFLSTILNLPPPERAPKASRTKPKQSAGPILEKPSDSPGEVVNNKPSGVVSMKAAAPQPPAQPEPEPAIASTFSATNSSRRGIIVKHATTRERSAATAAAQNPPSSAHPNTPHWTPKFAEQAACLRTTDDELAGPVAVNMAGDLISERVTVARAVAKLDATLSVKPSLAKAASRRSSGDTSEKSASGSPTPASHVATAMESVAR